MNVVMDMVFGNNLHKIQLNVLQCPRQSLILMVDELLLQRPQSAHHYLSWSTCFASHQMQKQLDTLTF